MAIKITSLGGTDWADGDVLFAADLIQTIEEASNFQIDRMTEDTTTYTQLNIGFVNKISLTFTPSSSNNMLLGMKVVMDLQGSNGNTIAARVSVTDGTRTWRTSGEATATEIIGVGDPDYPLAVSSSGSFTTLTHSFILGDCFHDTSDATNDIRVPGKNAMSDTASYTLTVDLSGNSNTASMEDVTISFFYVEGGRVTTSSGKFT